MSTISLNPDMISIETFKQVVNKIWKETKDMHLHIKTVKLFATSPIDYSRISEKRINTTPE